MAKRAELLKFCTDRISLSIGKLTITKVIPIVCYRCDRETIRVINIQGPRPIVALLGSLRMRNGAIDMYKECRKDAHPCVTLAEES